MKEVRLEGRRYIVCHNPEREPEDSRRRVEIVASLEQELTGGGLAKLARKKGYGRYIKIEEKGRSGIDWRRVERDPPLRRQVPPANGHGAVADGGGAGAVAPQPRL